MKNLVGMDEVKSINYVIHGDGPPVILIHGVAASLHDWKYLMPELARQGYRVFALDLPGHGDSAKPDDPNFYQFNNLYDQLVGWINSLCLDKPAVLVGHSLGGYLSLTYTINHPQYVSGLVLIDPYYYREQLSPFIRLINRQPAWGEKALRLVPTWLINAITGWDINTAANISPSARQQIVEDYKRASPYVLHIPHSVPDILMDLPRIDKSALVLWGERDLTLKPESFSQLVEWLPDAKGHMLSQCGHQPHLGKPDVTNQLVLEFLAALPENEIPNMNPHP